jgi:hypothetical protein
MHIRRVPRHDALGDLHTTRYGRTVRHRIRCRLGVDSNHTDARVVRAGVVLAVAEVANPRFELARVVFVHDGAVRDDLRLAGEGRPFARRVQEGDVDGRVLVQVVRLAGFGVRVEDEVEAAAFL